MQTSKKAGTTSEKILALISFGVIIYSIVQIFSGADSTNTYVGSILIALIILILSLVNVILQESSRLNAQSTKKDKETMMYKPKEMIEEAELEKSLEEHLDRVISNPRNKLVILRENKSNAVMISIEEYERMRAATDYLEEVQMKKLI